MTKTKFVASYGEDGGRIAYLSPRGGDEDWSTMEQRAWILDPPIEAIYGVNDAKEIKALMEKIIKEVEEN